MGVFYLTFSLAHAKEVTALVAEGDSFPYSLYRKWSNEYARIPPYVRVTYKAVGSETGRNKVISDTIDFAGSEVPFTPEELKKNMVFQFPVAIGGIVLVHNIKGIKTNELKLTADVLAKIFLGHIKTWDDVNIKNLNPTLKLPHQEIAVIYHSDSSSITRILTSYLSAANEEWKSKIGSKYSFVWPLGVGANGDKGVEGLVKSINNSIGYVGYESAVQEQLPIISLKNKSGFFVTPSRKIFEETASQAQGSNPKDAYLDLVDQPGPNSWPLMAASYVLLRKTESHPGHSLAVLKFFHWVFINGDPMAKQLNYYPIPEKLKMLIKKQWETEIKTKEGKQIWHKLSGSERTFKYEGGN